MQKFKNSLKHARVHALIFLGDLLPYGAVLLMTLMIGYRLGLDSASDFSVAYVYVAIVSSLVCGPNLLSIRRRMPMTSSPGAVVLAALGLRAAVIATGALLVMGVLYATSAKPGTMSLTATLFLGRFLETAVDSTATCVQYLRGASDYFVLRLIVFLIIFGCTVLGVFVINDNGIHSVAAWYLIGSSLGFMYSIKSSYKLLHPIASLPKEARAQTSEFGRFFVATAVFLAASRLHPVIVSFFYGEGPAGQFAMVQNLFSALGVAATGIAGVFFWSRNRMQTGQSQTGVPWRWLVGSMVGGSGLGVVGGAVLDWFYLQPLGSTHELSLVAWLLCLSTPFLLIQSILSNQLVLLKRDREMLGISALTATLGLMLITILVYNFGLIGAAFSVGVTALLSSAISAYIIRKIHE